VVAVYVAKYLAVLQVKWSETSANEKDLIAGYKIYWRLTDSSQWQNSVFVGNVTEHTLKNIVIDNYFFGVASVSKDGFENPIVFPGDAGSFGE